MTKVDVILDTFMGFGFGVEYTTSEAIGEDGDNQYLMFDIGFVRVLFDIYKVV